MKDRIKKLMDYKRLSAAELADKIGVQRSNVSHIINGRNNPSSAFIEKLLTTYPDINARWLITGEGDMSVADFPPRPDVPVTFGQPLAAPEAPDLPASKPEKEKEKSKRNIERIVVLYSDKSFRDYHPEI